MKVPARKIPVDSRPNDFPTSGKWLTVKKVIAMADHIAIPPQRGVISLCISRERNCKKAPLFKASFLTNGVIKNDSVAASTIVRRYSRT